MSRDYDYAKGRALPEDPNEAIMVFGAHKTKKLKDVPKNYWGWFLTQSWRDSWPGYREYAQSRVMQGSPSNEEREILANLPPIENYKPTEEELKLIDSLTPAGITLYNYQREGVPILFNTAKTHRNQILGDEMGLGKTCQAILFSDLVDARKILVICTASLRLKWIREFNKFSKVERSFLPLTEGKTPYRGEEVVITSYALATSLDWLTTIEWDLIIVDEFQALKKWKSARTQKILRHLEPKAKRNLYMSGTPMPKEIIDIQPVLSVCSDDAKDFHNFGNRFCYKRSNGYTTEYIGKRNEAELQRLLAPVMLRRLKKDVLPDLPPKTYTYMPIECDNAEARRIAEESLKYTEAALDSLHKGSSPTGELATIRRQLGLLKIPGTLRIVEEILEEKQKLVLMAYHIDVLTALSTELTKKKISNEVIRGATSPKDRDAYQQAFQSTEHPQVILGQIVAAGAGIDLTAADTLIVVEQDWVPANLQQAEDRIHRIGQLANAQILTLGIQGSLDDIMYKVLRTRIENIASIIGSSR